MVSIVQIAPGEFALQGKACWRGCSLADVLLPLGNTEQVYKLACDIFDAVAVPTMQRHLDEALKTTEETV